MSGAPRVSSAARLVLGFVAFVFCVGWAAPAAAATSHESAGVAPASRVVLGSSFHPIRTGVFGAWASGDYLLSTTPNTGPYGSGRGMAPILINDRLGTTSALDPQCDADGLGPPWALLSCHPLPPYGPFDVELYSIADDASDGYAQPRRAAMPADLPQ